MRDRLTALKELLNLDAHPGEPPLLQVGFGAGPMSADTETVDAPA